MLYCYIYQLTGTTRYNLAGTSRVFFAVFKTSLTGSLSAGKQSRRVLMVSFGREPSRNFFEASAAYLFVILKTSEVGSFPPGKQSVRVLRGAILQKLLMNPDHEIQSRGDGVYSSSRQRVPFSFLLLSRAITYTQITPAATRAQRKI